jgi:hypothetical protein
MPGSGTAKSGDGIPDTTMSPFTSTATDCPPALALAIDRFWLPLAS